MISSVLKVITGILQIRGATDGTLIGNTSDSLKTINETIATTGTTSPTKSTLVGANDGTNIRPLLISQAPVSLTTWGAIVRPIPWAPATFNLSAITIPLGNNKSMLALFNPGGSTVILKLQYLKIINNQTTNVTGVAADFRIRRITGLSAGTAVTPQSFDTSDTLGAGIIAAHNGTVAGESAADLMRYVWSSDEWGPGTADVESGDHAQQQMGYMYRNQPEAKAITLRPGQGITIKCVTNSTAGNFDFELCFTQEVP